MRAFGIISFLITVILSVQPSVAAEESFREVLSRIEPKTPQESLASLKVWDGFCVQLVCAEPMVCDPIAIDWGADGKLWVVEMGDYPDGVQSPGSAGGRIKFLEDLDQDGVPDRSTVFIEDLAFPTGVMPWRRGVLITCAPNILYAEDTDGDGKADHREVLYDGFFEGNPQHRVNSLRWGVDNWIYGSNGDSGGFITSKRTGDIVDIHARDFRIRPDSGAMQTQTGMSQYGRCRDDWGNWFGGRNLEPIWHCVLKDHYLRRNPYLAPPNPCVSLMDPPTCARVYPISETLPRFNELWTMNRFTSACGIAIYRDELFGPQFVHNFFVCEPTHNLVYRGLLHRKGVTFSGRRPPDQQTTEFLASRDHWFRPTQVRTGPDGALWVVDMYRLVIEHPDYIPPKWHDQLDFSAGRETGRIYRVFPEGSPPRVFTSLRRFSTAALVQSLEDANGPRRDMVQQLLIERADQSAVTLLSRLVAESTRARCRLSALCTLDGLKAATVPTIKHALSDRHPAVRRHAIRIAEPLLNGSPPLQKACLALQSDPDPQVRMQLAYSLGEWDDRRAGEALAQLAIRDAEDPFLIAAVMSSATGYPGEMLERIMTNRTPNASQAALLENLLRLVFEAGQEDVLALGLTQIVSPGGESFESWRFQVLASFLDVLEYGGNSLKGLRQDCSRDLQTAIDRTRPIFSAARTVAIDPEASLPCRIQAVRLVGRGLDPTREDIPSLAELLVPQTPAALQRAVVDALRTLRPPDLPDILLEGWEQHGPEVRPEILNGLVSNTKWTLELLDRVAAEEILSNEIGEVIRNKLIVHNSAEVRRRADELLDPSTPEERLAVIESYRDKLKVAGNAKRGCEVFRQHCSSCHQLDGVGTDIGSDLLALTDRSPETLLDAILDPNRAVEPRFVEYSVVTITGRLFSGIVATETGNSITLIDAQGAKHVLLRADLDEFVSTGRSMMPDGIEKLFAKPVDLIDVIAYLQSVSAELPKERPARLPPPS